MKFTYFRFENFKGIIKGKLDFSRNSDSKVFTLVGLNESGKTTVLEAINYFAYKRETLDALEFESYEPDDIHDLIPINKRDNFNEAILVEAGIELDDEDIDVIKEAFIKEGIVLEEYSKNVSYTQKYFFKNSLHLKEKNGRFWSYDFRGRTKRGKIVKKLNNTQALIASRIIIERMPSILYFPNFLFEFPSKIFLDDNIDDPKQKIYQTIIQDVLDSLDNDTNIEEHLISRIESDDPNERRNLISLIGKMQRHLTDLIFSSWNQIFNKELKNTEVVLDYGIDSENGAYLEFNIKDDVDTYRINERSLGFRWFFVYILLTQYRSFRKEQRNVFFLFDEPASNLHPSAQNELLKSFEKLPKVLYTTHSHYLINPKWLEHTYVIKNSALNYEDEEKSNAKNTDIEITKYREFAVKSPNQSNYFQPILEILDYRPTNLELIPNVIITEGKSDFYIFNYFQDVLRNSKKPLKFCPGTSSSNLETLISLYLGWRTTFFVLLDSDRAGLSQKKRYQQIFGNTIDERIFTYSDIDPNWKNFETEDLFTKRDKLLIQQTSYPSSSKINKKIFIRSIQELFINNHKISIDRQSINNLNKVIKFLEKQF